MMNLMNLLEFHASLGHLALNFIIISRLGDKKRYYISKCNTQSGFHTHQKNDSKCSVHFFFEIQVHLEVLHFNVTQDMFLIPEPSDAL